MEHYFSGVFCSLLCQSLSRSAFRTLQCWVASSNPRLNTLHLPQGALVGFIFKKVNSGHGFEFTWFPSLLPPRPCSHCRGNWKRRHQSTETLCFLQSPSRGANVLTKRQTSSLKNMVFNTPPMNSTPIN